MGLVEERKDIRRHRWPEDADHLFCLWWSEDLHSSHLSLLQLNEVGSSQAQCTFTFLPLMQCIVGTEGSALQYKQQQSGTVKT